MFYVGKPMKTPSLPQPKSFMNMDQSMSWKGSFIAEDKICGC